MSLDFSAAEKFASLDEADSALMDSKQPKTLSTAITVDGTSKTTVEAALGAINTLAASKQAALLNATNVSGYDATKTQTLKNIEGTLTWVTDEA